MAEILMPRLSDTMEEGVLSRWLKKVGDPVHKGDVLAEIETDKATMDLEAFEEGVLERLLVDVGATVPIGAVVAVVGDGSGTVTDPPPTSPEVAGAPDPTVTTTAAQPAAAAASGKFRTSPLARKVARDNDIDLAALTGTGPDGRIVRADVDDAVAAQDEHSSPGHPPTDHQPARAGTPVNPRAPVVAGTGDTRIPLNNIRRITAARLTESQAVPHFSLTNVVDAEKLLAFRSEINAVAANASTGAGVGVKISVNDLVVRAAAVTLRAHPQVNSSWAGDSIVRHGRINVGIAVAIEEGLIVPVVTDADRKTLGEISIETSALATRARAGQLTPDEFGGGTFTVSNLGMFGIDQFTAVINPPEAAILGVGAANQQPVVRDGQLVSVPSMKITLTVDHRVVDGATAAAFLRDLTRILQEPIRIVV